MRICLHGGPGSGKSTLAAKLFADLKSQHISVELVTEYIKQWAYQKRLPSSFDQVLIFGHQIHLEDIVLRAGSALITDSPLYLQAFYAKEYGYGFWEELLSLSRKFDLRFPSMNLFLPRKVPYQTFGRYETEQEAIARDDRMVHFLEENGIVVERLGDYESTLKMVSNALNLWSATNGSCS